MEKVVDLSIIVPVYNVEAYLAQCLDSILQYDFHNKEIIIVNDGSTDCSKVIIESYYKANPDIIRVENQENQGLSVARNTGLAVAKGKYISFIDSDDIMMPRTLDSLLSAIINENADIAIADYYEFTEEGKDEKTRFDKACFPKVCTDKKKMLEALFFVDVSFSVWNKIYKRSFLEDNSLLFYEGMWFEDLDYIFRAFWYASKIIKVDEVLIGYRQRPQSIMKSVNIKAVDKLIIVNQIKQQLCNAGIFELYKEQYKILYLKMSFSLLALAWRGHSNYNIAKTIVSKVFHDDYFAIVLKERLFYKNRLSKKEVFLYNSLKMFRLLLPFY